jgi:hypothetical protein
MDVLEKVRIGEAKGERGALKRKDRKRLEIFIDCLLEVYVLSKTTTNDRLSTGELKS